MSYVDIDPPLSPPSLSLSLSLSLPLSLPLSLSLSLSRSLSLSPSGISIDGHQGFKSSAEALAAVAVASGFFDSKLFACAPCSCRLLDSVVTVAKEKNVREKREGEGKRKRKRKREGKEKERNGDM